MSQPLGEDHQLDAFTCGNDVLDRWLTQQALRAQKAGTARTYVWCQHGHSEVLAYFAIAPTEVQRIDLPSRSLAGGSTVIPAYLLARLALHRDLHDQGLGGELLDNALNCIVDAARIAGGRLIVVDAIDSDAHAFYRHVDFIPVASSDRLYLKIAAAISSAAIPALELDGG